MSNWRVIIGEATLTPAEIDATVLGGTFRSGATSSVQIRCNMPADATQILDYDDPVTILRGETTFFQGKVRKVPKSQSANSESQVYLIEDAWSDLERTTYQEPWDTHDGPVLTPRVYLGIDEDGLPITLGEQIQAAITFAGGLTLGSIPEGMELWPTEVIGLSCAEVIRTSLRFHPDWIPWIDHTTSPPTFNVTPVASASALTLALGDYSELQITDVSDRLPDGVRIVFQTVDEFNAADAEDPEDLVVERVVAVDKFPSESADNGPGILTTVVDLAGARAVVQKQQVQTRAMPDDQTSLRAWLKKQYPAFRGMPDAAFQVTRPKLTLVPPDPADVRPGVINPENEHLAARDLDDTPRQLVAGTIPEWSRRRTGQVRIEWGIRATTDATAAQRKIIESMPTADTVTGTNATTKVYVGAANFTEPENAPSGIAQLYYQTITAGTRYQGSVSFLGTDVAPPWHGKKLNITGGATGWATMAAPIHAVQWDAQSDEVTVDFGPTPDYAFQDFLEYLRLLNRRTPHWITGNERTRKELGEESGASTYDDAVGPFDTPDNKPEMLPAYRPPFHLTVSVDESGETPAWKWSVSSTASSVTNGLNGDGYDLAPAGADWATGAIKFDVDTAYSATVHIYLVAAVDSGLELEDFNLVASTTALDEVEMSGDPLAQVTARLYIGTATLAGTPAVGTASQAVHTAQKAIHGFLNGTIVRTLRAAPATPTSL
jgi:hypothetical protein